MTYPGEAILVDDDPLEHVLLKHAFESHPIFEDVHFFSTPMEAREFLKSDEGASVRYVITDLNMPVQNGFEFLESIRAELGDAFGNMTCAVISNAIDYVHRASGYDNHLADMVLPKPSSFDEIQSIMSSIAEKSLSLSA